MLRKIFPECGHQEQQDSNRFQGVRSPGSLETYQGTSIKLGWPLDLQFAFLLREQIMANLIFALRELFSVWNNVEGSF